MVLVTKEYLPTSVLCFMLLVFRFVIDGDSWCRSSDDVSASLTFGRPKCAIRDPMSQNFNKFMLLNADNFSRSVYSLTVYISCIMQHVNNILMVCFQKNYENLCPSHERPSFGLSWGYSIYMAKAVLEYFVRRVVTNFLEISFQRPLPTVLTTNTGNAMIIWRTVTDIIFFLFIKWFAYFFKFGNK
jgi:hypothetical protein